MPGEAGCSGEREDGNNSVTCGRTDSGAFRPREGPGRMCDESWQQDLACVHWRLVRGRVFFSVLGPVSPLKSFEARRGCWFYKPHGGRRATQFLCCPVHQRQSVKDASEEVTRVGNRGWLAYGWLLFGGVGLCAGRPIGDPVSTQTVPISASGLQGSEPLVDR